MSSEAKKAANKRWNDKNMNTKYDHIHVVVPKGDKERIAAAAAADGKSVNAWIGDLIHTELKRAEE